MLSVADIKQRIEAAVPGASVQLVTNPGPAKQDSLVLDHAHAVAIASFLKRDPELRFDYCSNVTGVDWLDRVEKKKVKTKVTDETGAEKEVEQTVEESFPGYLEAVYHLYSTVTGAGPLVLRLRTEGRAREATVPSLTPVFRAAEFQEREIYDLYGIRFTGHPDLRRILMWDGFVDFPMRKDYVEPDDYEYEPTPHDDVLEKAKRHYQHGPADNDCRFAPN